MTKHLRILLVEDVPSDAKLVSAALRRGGLDFEIERVETADAMRDMLATRRWDAVISDWSLPTFGAMAALAMLQESEQDLPFIIVSGTIGEEPAVEAMRLGAHDYVLKDKLSRLAPAVEREIRESRLREEKVVAGAALRASEERYRRIVETTTQGVAVIDVSSRASFVNGRMATMLGYPREQIIGKDVRDFVDEEWRAAATRDVSRSTDGPIQIESKLRRSDGAEVWVQAEVAPTVDAAGVLHGWFVMVKDVTDVRASQEALRVSEARFRTLWDSGLVLLAIFDAKDVLHDINEHGAAMLGYERTELLATRIPWGGLTAPEWHAGDEAARVQLLNQGVASAWEKELLRKDGTRVSVVAGAAMHDRSLGIAIAVDITDKKRAQNELLERTQLAALTAEVAIALALEDSLPNILQACTEAATTRLGAAFVYIWLVSTTSGVLELKAVAGESRERIVGLYENGMGGETRIGRIAEQRRASATDDLSLVAAEDSAWIAEQRLVSFVGEPLLVAGQLVGVIALFARHRWSDAARTGISALADAIAVGAQRKRGEEAGISLEAQLRQAQKMEAVGLLAGGIAHDFNNVLSVILSYGDLILMDLAAEDPMRGDVEEIRKAGLRAADLTRQLLMFSRQQVIAPRVLDLNEVLVGIDKMLRRVVGEDVALSFRAGVELGRVNADAGSVEQVLMNLAVNARDAMPSGGRLLIETSNVRLDEAFVKSHHGAKPGDYVMLSVTDTGHGMDKATLARIFEPFYTTKAMGKGTGLGLSTVFGIVQQSGGTVWVYSEPAWGTTFKVYFPRVDAAATTPPPRIASLVGHGTETILLVEDEQQVRNVTRGILARHGYTVLEAGNASEALAVCEAHPEGIDLLLTDVVMPGMSGPELARRLGPLRPGMKVLCMSGYTDDAALRHGVVDASLAYLQKPITVESLTRKVRSVLDGVDDGRAGAGSLH